MFTRRCKQVLKALMAVSTASLVLAGTPAYAASDTLRVATEGTYKPWSFKDADGKLQGFDVDIANALCEDLHVKCDIVAQSWDGIIPGLQASRYDAIIASMSMTPARRKQVLFTNKYKDVISIFIAHKGSITDVTPEGGSPGRDGAGQAGGALRADEAPLGAAADADGLVTVVAPLPGTFYRAPRPGAPPFVEVGDEVGADTVVAIIETMKLMNSVPAGASGRVARILVENGEFAPLGTALVHIEPDSPTPNDVDS